MSSDGMILAIGAARNDGNGNCVGRVRVFALDGATDYVRRGLDIDGVIAYDFSRVSLAM